MATLERSAAADDRAAAGPAEPGPPGSTGAPSVLPRWPSQTGRGHGPLGLSTTFALADFMAVAVALPALQHATGASFPELEWVLAAFALAMAVSLAMSGYLYDRFGPRTLLLAGLAVLGAGSLLAAATNVAAVVIVARALQGAGAGLVPAGAGGLGLPGVLGPGAGGPGPAFGVAPASVGTSPASALGLPEVRAADKGLVRAAQASVRALALAASPLAGGLLTTYLGWRSVFLVEAAAALAALAGAAVVLGRQPGSRQLYAPPDRPGGPAGRPNWTGRPDWTGLGLLASAFAVLVAGLVRTTANLDGWQSSGILACLACSGLLLLAFVAVESVSPAPLLPPWLWRQRSFVAATAATLGTSMALSGTVMLLALYFSSSLAYPASGAGARLVALTGMSVILAGLASAWPRLVPAQAVLPGGLILVAGGLYAMSGISATSGWAELVPGLILAGAGLGLTSSRLTMAVAASGELQRARAAPRPGPLPHLGDSYERDTAASRVNLWVRQLGVATGVAVSGSVFATHLTNALGRQFPAGSTLAGQGPTVAALVLQGKVRGAARTAGEGVVRASFASAMHDVVLVAAGVGGACAVLALAVGVAAVRRRAARDSATPEPSLPAVRPQPGAWLSVPAPEPARDAVTAGEPRPAAPEATPAGALGPSVGPPPAAPKPTTAPAQGAGAEPSPAGAPAPRLPRRTSGVAAQGPFGASPASRPSGGSCALEGRVTDRDGRPIAGAQLTLMSLRGERAGEGVSDARGWFAIEAGAAGSYTLVATAPTYRAAARVVQVGSAGGRAELKLFGLGSLTGMVTSAKDGSPLEADLVLRTPEGAVAMRSRAGADGTFAFPDLLEGSYELVASAQGHSTQRLPVDVERGAARVAAVTLTGFGHIYGAVSSSQGAWVPDVSVTLSLPSGLTVATTQTDDAGSYRFGDVSEGEYLLCAGDGEALPVEVAAGQAVAVEVRLTVP